MMASYGANGTPGDDNTKIMVWPDSSIIHSGKPVFTPAGDDFYLHAGFGVRIDAVGKTISQKFASRYYSKAFPVVFILSEKASTCILEGADPRACDIVRDYSVIIGEESEASLIAGCDKFNVSLESLKGDEKKEFEINNVSLMSMLDRSVSAASRLNTIKTGDYVGAFSGLRLKMERDSLLKIASCGTTLLENKLK